jgi:hypothetical protein
MNSEEENSRVFVCTMQLFVGWWGGGVKGPRHESIIIFTSYSRNADQEEKKKDVGLWF